MIVDNICMIAGFLLICLATNFELLLLGDSSQLLSIEINTSYSSGRLLTGHSSGSNLVSSPIFVSEISHPDLRGASSVLTMVCYTSGFFVSMLCGASLSWRLAATAFIATPVISLGMILLCRESPSWLLRRGREEEALNSLYFYRGDMEISR